ncbi:hypothetical protein BH09ACT7_BH09ACT7_56870 [soil metagenome]
MGALRSLLEVYGALDRAARQTSEPEIRTQVFQFLTFLDPADDTEWYRQLTDLFFPNEEFHEPDITGALRTIAEETQSAPLTIPQKSRLLYAVATTARMSRVAETFGQPFFPDTNDDVGGALFDVMGAIAPAEASLTQLDPNEFLSATAEIFIDPAQFDLVKALAIASGWAPQEITDVPICKTAQGQIGTTKFVRVDTFCQTDKVSLNNLKAIVNPYNWKKNYPDFFCDMLPTGLPARTDGWGTVLEKVGFCPFNGAMLATHLKYLPTATKPTEARLDYDLSDPCPPYTPGDGQVTIDHGFINMWALGTDPTAAGVRVRTSKVVSITGIDTVAQKALVCILGYGNSSAEFLFGEAKNPSANAAPFGFLGGAQFGPTHGQPKPVNDHVVATAYKLWAGAVQDAGLSYFNVAGKWVAGELTSDDLATHCQTVTGEFAKLPWEFLAEATKPRYPKGTSGTGSSSGGNQ